MYDSFYTSFSIFFRNSPPILEAIVDEDLFASSLSGTGTIVVLDLGDTEVSASAFFTPANFNLLKKLGLDTNFDSSLPFANRFLWVLSDASAASN